MRLTPRISRRDAITSFGIAPVAAALSWPPFAWGRARHTFVLVHGAWHGGWCWQRVARLLCAAGHDVYAPTLTGLGDRSHLLSESVTLDTHTSDILSLLHFEDITEVTLVGHSYGGMVIAAVAGEAADRLRRLIFIDAFLPENGKAVVDYAPVPPVREDGWRIPVPLTPTGFGITDAQDAAWVGERLTDQPLGTFTQPVRWDHIGDMYTRAFIQCTNTPWFVEAAERATRLGFTMHSMMDAGHDAMITQPHELAQLLSA
jgi:pimeloyl-ACP methyl ester carboxylesterase